MKRLIAAISFLIMFCAAGWADSPLTSTSFADSYSDSPYVFIAKSAGVKLPEVLLEFLADPDSPVDERLAAINQLGWDIEGTTTSQQFFDYLMKRYQVTDGADLLECMDAGTMAVLAYAEALSNYDDLSAAGPLAHYAVDLNEEKSFSVALVAALIDAQNYLESDWGMVYKVVADVVADRTLVRDMRQSAVDSIMSYIDLYQEYWLKQNPDQALPKPAQAPSNPFEELLESIGEVQSALPMDLGDGMIMTGLFFYENYIWCQFMVDDENLRLFQQVKGEELEEAIDDLLKEMVKGESDEDDFSMKHLVAHGIGINLIFWSAPQVNKATLTLTPEMIQEYLNK